MVTDIPLFTERLDELMCLLQVVSGNHRKQVVINLVLKSTAEPVHEPLRNTMSSNDVARCSYLKAPEIRSSVSVVDCHTIVSQAEHNC
mmetsp:Transcript_24288/g.57190  ORF Transcript_24288/g.57190 Transcript_24288/m.57190 type:complete len:88 (-) Transcript_24288:1167-1430(-)